jgi:hypothetical protein
MKSGEMSQREHSRALHISLEYPRGLRIIGEQSGGGRQGGHVGGGPRGHSGAHLILYIRPFPHSLAIFFFSSTSWGGSWALDFGPSALGLWALGFDIYYHSLGSLVLDVDVDTLVLAFSS